MDYQAACQAEGEAVTDAEINAWVDSIELDLANVASDDRAWRLRETARKEVYASRDLTPQPWPAGPSDPPGLVST